MCRKCVSRALAHCWCGRTRAPAPRPAPVECAARGKRHASTAMSEENITFVAIAVKHALKSKMVRRGHAHRAVKIEKHETLHSSLPFFPSRHKVIN